MAELKPYPFEHHNKEKLIELLKPYVSGLACEQESGSCELTSCRSCNARNLADHLIANGVTVQEWIPASEPPKESGEYIAMIRDGAIATTLCYSEYYKVWCEFDDDEHENPYNVTCWMPLPQPPKEDL